MATAELETPATRRGGRPGRKPGRKPRAAAHAGGTGNGASTRDSAASARAIGSSATFAPMLAFTREVQGLCERYGITAAAFKQWAATLPE